MSTAGPPSLSIVTGSVLVSSTSRHLSLLHLFRRVVKRACGSSWWASRVPSRDPPVRLLVLLLLAIPSFARVVSRDVEREIHERESARVIVMLRGTTMSQLTDEDFTIRAHWTR